ncbi:MAG: SAM-dependent chlorinase/fluorinase, partial [Myxococcota bacterium]|nr:SAM-dependent chlorinase/fluorinase [Myxococcota bacterium]
DLAHDLPAHQVGEGALALRASAPHFPTGTVHLVVVDPGVGTARRPVVVASNGHVFVGPDNGLLLPAAEAIGGGVTCRQIEDHALMPPERSATFHGRDIFAPTAAALASGKVRLEEVGEVVDPRPSSLPAPSPHPQGGLVAKVVAVDRFGNLVTNVSRRVLTGLGTTPVLELPDGTDLTVRETYGDVAVGDLLALIGSSGALEVAVRDGSASQRLSIRSGDGFRVHDGVGVGAHLL